MKNFKKHLLVFAVFTCSISAFSTAKGFSHYYKLHITRVENNNAVNRGDKSTPDTAGRLPINKQAWLLLIAGTAIGCNLIINKNGERKSQTAVIKQTNA